MNITLKYNNPGEFPIHKFIEFKNIVEDDSLLEFEKHLKILSIFTDTPLDTFYKMKPKDIEPMLATMNANIHLYNTTKHTYDNHPKKLILNGRKYTVTYKISKLNMAQYIDFQIYAAQSEDYIKSLTDLLSVFIIPNGHKYGENYDMDEVKSDISTLDINTALSISSFMKKRCVTSMKNKLYSVRLMMKMSLWRVKDPALKQEMKKTIALLKEAEKTM